MKALNTLLLFVAVLITSNALAQTEVFVTKNGKSYHKKECRLLPIVHIKTTIKKAKGKAYVPCKVCVPKGKGNKSKVLTKKNTKKISKKKRTSAKKKSTSRCTATTQKGAQCKRRTKNTSGKCWQHH